MAGAEALAEGAAAAGLAVALKLVEALVGAAAGLLVMFALAAAGLAVALKVIEALALA